MRWLWWLTGGRPMRYVRPAFWDSVGKVQVNVYVDRMGRKWLAVHLWALFRVDQVRDGRQA